MKEDANIEELFKQKFENFEVDVDPSAWANIQQGVNAGAAGSGAATGGLSTIAKVAIIAGAAAVTTVSVWYFNSDNGESSNEQVNNTVEIAEENNYSNEELSDEILVENENDQNIESEETEITNEEENISSNEEEPDNNDIVNENSSESSNTDENTVSNESTDIESILEGQNEVDDSKENSSNQTTDEIEESVEQDKEPTPIKKLFTEMEVLVNKNQLEFNSNAENYSSVYWDFGDGNSSNSSEGTHVYEQPGIYTVTMEVHGNDNSAGQVDVKSKTITIEGTSEITKIPNIFTPNGDNNNDIWSIEMKDIKEINVLIQNKNGQKVFESKDLDFSWDGRSPDGRVHPGKYGYVIMAVGIDGKVHKKAGTIDVRTN